MHHEAIHNIEIYAQSFQRGDEKALSFFYHEFHAALALYANKWIEDRFVAEEIASNAFVKTWKFHWKINSYAAIRAYLYRTVRNECYDILRIKREKVEVYTDALPILITNENAFDQLVRSEVAHTIYCALKEIAPASSKVLTMQFIEGKSTSEIATELNLSPHTVRTQKVRGLKSLRKILLRPLLVVAIFLMNLPG